jgi:hypothetical protein
MVKRTCSVEGCDRPSVYVATGWCSPCYKKWWRRNRRPAQTVEERFWPKVDKDGPVPDFAPHLGPCWIWTGTPALTGYGTFSFDRRKFYTHRIAYGLVVGPIPEGLQIDHLCRVRLCCNPAHLEPVTQAENIRRGEGGIHQRARTHCPSGHPYDEENTYILPSRPNARYCRACQRQHWRTRGKGKS